MERQKRSLSLDVMLSEDDNVGPLQDYQTLAMAKSMTRIDCFNNVSDVNVCSTSCKSAKGSNCCDGPSSYHDGLLAMRTMLQEASAQDSETGSSLLSTLRLNYAGGVVVTASWGGIGTEAAATERADDGIHHMGLSSPGDVAVGFAMQNAIQIVHDSSCAHWTSGC